MDEEKGQLPSTTRSPLAGFFPPHLFPNMPLLSLITTTCSHLLILQASLFIFSHHWFLKKLKAEGRGPVFLKAFISKITSTQENCSFPSVQKTDKLLCFLCGQPELLLNYWLYFLCSPFPNCRLLSWIHEVTQRLISRNWYFFSE